ncbi:MAG: FlgD immunoglobulin-like domain containing protein [bacterium]
MRSLGVTLAAPALRSATLLTLAIVALCLAATHEPVRAGAAFNLEEADANSSTNTGQFNSIALDSQGNPHVSYLELISANLRYATKQGGAWVVEVADGSPNSVGWHSAIAVDATDEPHIAYQDQTTIDLKYATRASGAWTTETVDGGPAPASVGEYVSIALDAQGDPHISYVDLYNGNLKYATKSGGAWTIETADATPWNVGYWNDIALDSNGNPHISHHDLAMGNLKYARRVGGAWINETVRDTPDAEGWHSSIAIDGLSNVHISFYNYGDPNEEFPTAGNLEYAVRVNGAWTFETADASPNDVGSGSAIALDATNVPHVAYFDATLLDVNYARRAPAGWEIGVVDGSSNFTGQFVSIAVDAASRPHVSYFDLTKADLRYAVGAGATGVAPALDADRFVRVLPNPARGDRVEITFRVGDALDADVAIYDVTGRRVKSIAPGARLAGVRSITWDGRAASGEIVGAGVYFVRVSSGARSETERLTILR